MTARRTSKKRRHHCPECGRPTAHVPVTRWWKCLACGDTHAVE